MAQNSFVLCTKLGILSILIHGSNAIDSTELKTLDGTKYCFVDTRTNFTSARTACNDVGAHVARFPNYSTAKFVTNDFTAEDVWLDVNDIDKDGEFRYSDGSVPDWLEWLPGEPSETKGEHCVRFTVEYTSDRMMTNKKCTETYRYICERELPTTPLQTRTTTTQSSTTDSTTMVTVPDDDADDSTTYGYNLGTDESIGLPIIIGVTVGAAVAVVSVIVLSVLCVRTRRMKPSNTQAIANDTYVSDVIPSKLSTTQKHPQQPPNEDVNVDNKLYDEANKQQAMVGSQVNNNEPEIIRMANVDKEMYENWGIDGAHSTEGQAPEQVYSKPYPRGGANSLQEPNDRPLGDDVTDDVVVDNLQYATWT